LEQRRERAEAGTGEREGRRQKGGERGKGGRGKETEG